MEIEIIAEGLQVPEGPVAMPDGSVLVTEVMRGTITRITPQGAVEIVAHLGGGPNGGAIGADGALYVCNNGGGYRFEERDGIFHITADASRHVGGSIQRVDLATGAFATLYTESGGRALVAPNDLVIDRLGGIWFTDYGAFTEDGRIYGSVHYAAQDGSRAICCRRGIISPNGIGLSPDQQVLYVADTFTARLWAFDIVAPGELAPPPGLHMPARLVQTLQGYQLLDSLAVEEGGKVCVGTLIRGGITIFDPDGSTEHVPAPDSRITNICFGGADRCDAWLTGATTGKLFKMRWPRPGLALNFN
jgi:gluconolactonase